jgi:hypothetical protein
MHGLFAPADEEVADVAVAHHVVLALHPQLPVGADLLLRLVVLEVVVVVLVEVELNVLLELWGIVVVWSVVEGSERVVEGSGRVVVGSSVVVEGSSCRGSLVKASSGTISQP